LNDYEKRLDSLKQMTDVQCWNGNWNYDGYMHGLANGMIFALALMEDKDPEFLNPPEVWLSDIELESSLTVEAESFDE